MSVAIMGGGAFGTALAIALSGQSAVSLWLRDVEAARSMAETRRTPRLPDAVLPETVQVTHDIGLLGNANEILLAVPMQQLRGVLRTHAAHLHGAVLVACCKGIELETGLGPVEVIEDMLPNARLALLTGPSFARDIAAGLPTALTLACTDCDLGARLQQDLSTPALRLYRTTDTIGAELGGALKNVVAIACGAVIGAGLGDSARAALMTRGYAEMQRMAVARGASPETLAGLSGFGDLALTCTSELSRNYRLGLTIGRGETFDPSLTVEGAATARAVLGEADRRGVEMPIARVVVGLLDNRLTIDAAMTQLLSRPLRAE